MPKSTGLTREISLLIPISVKILQILIEECDTEEEEKLVLSILSQFLEVRKNRGAYYGSRSNLVSQ